MATGPGKYDDTATLARMMTNAQAVALIVLNGNRGSGFAVQAVYSDITLLLPDLLEELARQIRADQENPSCR